MLQNIGQLLQPCIVPCDIFFRLFAHQRFADMCGDTFKPLYSRERKTALPAVVDLEQADDFILHADRDERDGGVSRMNAIVMRIPARILIGGKIQQRGRIIDPEAAAFGEQRMVRVGFAGNHQPAGAFQTDFSVAVAAQFAVFITLDN